MTVVGPTEPTLSIIPSVYQCHGKPFSQHTISQSVHLGLTHFGKYYAASEKQLGPN